MRQRKPFVMNYLFPALALIAITFNASALPRDEAKKQEFRRSAPCPSTNKTTGPCPGYEVDHKKALMNGGADHPKNMQWLKKENHTAKTKQDVADCKDAYLCKNKKLKKKLPWEKKAKNEKVVAKAKSPAK
jgi:hypothetical protein